MGTSQLGGVVQYLRARMRKVARRRWFWSFVLVFAVIVIAALFVAYASRDSEERKFLEIAGLLERDSICSEPRFSRSKWIMVVTPTPSPQGWPGNTTGLTVQAVPDNRTLWERIQDEYRYQ